MFIKKGLPLFVLLLTIVFHGCNIEPSLMVDNYQQNQDSPDYYLKKGEEYLNNGSLDKAESYFNKVLKLKKDDENGLLGLAEVYFRRYLFKKAIAYAKKVIEKHPQNKKAYEKLGEYYWFSGDIDNAILAYKKVIQLDPNDYSSLEILYDFWRLKYGKNKADKKLTQYTKFNSIEEVRKKLRTNISGDQDLQLDYNLSILNEFLICILQNDKKCALEYYNKLKSMNSPYLSYAKSVLKSKGFL